MDKLVITDFLNANFVSDKIGKSYSTTPFRYLRNIRMNKAYQLTLEKRRISQIAIDVGYSDVYQFSRAFKKHFGFSPSEIQ